MKQLIAFPSMVSDAGQSYNIALHFPPGTEPGDPSREQFLLFSSKGHPRPMRYRAVGFGDNEAPDQLATLLSLAYGLIALLVIGVAFVAAAMPVRRVVVTSFIVAMPLAAGRAQQQQAPDIVKMLIGFRRAVQQRSAPTDGSA